jgi:GNAT superfamily N-acetyltransferase
VTITYEWRGRFTNAEINALHAEGFGHPLRFEDWWARVNRHSLGWVCARKDSMLVGFVNIAWDGGIHAFVLDPLVTPRLQRQSLGARLIAVAAGEAQNANCDWLHVDFDDHLQTFYFNACGFTPTNAGLIRLSPLPRPQ